MTKNLDKFVKKAKEESKNFQAKEQEEKKINWKKLIIAIWKMVEPEIKKLPKIYFTIPGIVAWFILVGMYKHIEFITNLILRK